jgi:diguanylate cyclase (GGDEF)-like protein
MESIDASSCVSILHDISKGLSQRTSIHKTLEELCGHVEKFFKPRHLAFLLVEPESGDLTFSLVSGDKASMISGKKLRKGRGVAGWVAETAESLLIADTASDPRFQSQFLTVKTQGSSSIMAVPLKSGELVYGVLELFDSTTGAHYAEEDLRALAAIADITSVAIERAYYFQAMKRMAETDPLTGLPNRRIFERYLEREIEVCKRYGTPSTILLLTLKDLRELNEIHGVTTADTILQALAAIVSEDVRKVDVTCRIGANKFAVVMPNTTQKHATEVARRVNLAIEHQGSIRKLPSFSVAMEVRTGTQEDITPLLGITVLGTAGAQGFRKFRNVAANIFQLLTEEKQSLERRKYYRKGVQLAGRFDNPETGASGDMLVENVSLNGVGFTTLLTPALAKNDLIRIWFRLDDTRNTEVARAVRVRYLKDRYIGAQFADQKSYDGDLGFYLMR